MNILGIFRGGFVTITEGDQKVSLDRAGFLKRLLIRLFSGFRNDYVKCENLSDRNIVYIKKDSMEQIKESTFLKIFNKTDINVVFKDSPLPPPPEDGIKVGLPNMTSFGTFRNTCWFNTTLKFISCTDYYDTMLTGTPPDGKEELQRQLRNMVFLLRHGEEGYVHESAYKRLMDIVGKEVKGFESSGRQEDAPEFLMKLTEALDWEPENKMEVAKVYNGEPKKRPKVTSVGQFDLTIPNDVKGELDVSQLMSIEEELEVRADEDEDGTSYKYKAHDCFTHLPDTIMINVKRGALEGKRSNPIKLNDDGLVELIEYNEESEPQKVRRYKIAASMTHRGETVRSGHYVCEERIEGGTVTHSDMSIEPADDPNMGTRGYYLRLELVKEESVSDEGT